VRYRSIEHVIKNFCGLRAKIKGGVIFRSFLLYPLLFLCGLAERLDQIQAGQPLVEIKQFDLFRFFEVVRFFGKLFGVFENIKDACFDSGEYRDTGARNFDPGCGVDKFDDFVFFDAIHPTGQVHQFVGKALSRAAHKLIDD